MGIGAAQHDGATTRHGQHPRPGNGAGHGQCAARVDAERAATRFERQAAVGMERDSVADDVQGAAGELQIVGGERARRGAEIDVVGDAEDAGLDPRRVMRVRRQQDHRAGPVAAGRADDEVRARADRRRVDQRTAAAAQARGGIAPADAAREGHVAQRRRTEEGGIPEEVEQIQRLGTVGAQGEGGGRRGHASVGPVDEGLVQRTGRPDRPAGHDLQAGHVADSVRGAVDQQRTVAHRHGACGDPSAGTEDQRATVDHRRPRVRVHAAELENARTGLDQVDRVREVARKDAPGSDRVGERQQGSRAARDIMPVGHGADRGEAVDRQVVPAEVHPVLVVGAARPDDQRHRTDEGVVDRQEQPVAPLDVQATHHVARHPDVNVLHGQRTRADPDRVVREDEGVAANVRVEGDGDVRAQNTAADDVHAGAGARQHLGGDARSERDRSSNLIRGASPELEGGSVDLPVIAAAGHVDRIGHDDVCEAQRSIVQDDSRRRPEGRAGHGGGCRIADHQQHAVLNRGRPGVGVGSRKNDAAKAPATADDDGVAARDGIGDDQRAVAAAEPPDVRSCHRRVDVRGVGGEIEHDPARRCRQVGVTEQRGAEIDRLARVGGRDTQRSARDEADSARHGIHEPREVDADGAAGICNIRAAAADGGQGVELQLPAGHPCSRLIGVRAAQDQQPAASLEQTAVGEGARVRRERLALLGGEDRDLPDSPAQVHAARQEQSGTAVVAADGQVRPDQQVVGDDATDARGVREHRHRRAVIGEREKAAGKVDRARLETQRIQDERSRQIVVRRVVGRGVAEDEDEVGRAAHCRGHAPHPVCAGGPGLRSAHGVGPRVDLCTRPLAQGGENSDSDQPDPRNPCNVHRHPPPSCAPTLNIPDPAAQKYTMAFDRCYVN